MKELLARTLAGKLPKPETKQFSYFKIKNYLMLNILKTLAPGLFKNWLVITKKTHLAPVKVRVVNMHKWPS